MHQQQIGGLDRNLGRDLCLVICQESFQTGSTDSRAVPCAVDRGLPLALEVSPLSKLVFLVFYRATLAPLARGTRGFPLIHGSNLFHSTLLLALVYFS